MSSPAQGGPSVPPEEKKQSVGSRLVKRMNTMVKRPFKRMSISGSSKAGPSSAAVKTSEPVPAETKVVTDLYPNAKKVPRMQLHEERARKLGERFGLEIKPSEWHSTAGDALRVEKPIRMRVHRICHECKTTFGSAKECPNPECKHQRCKSCTRYPPRRSEAEKIASRERRAAILKEREENAPILADWDTSDKKIVLKRTKPGGGELVYKKPRQRVRRLCCKCEKLFGRGSKTCEGCSHARCTDCKRDPAKKHLYPYGYPGDEFGENSIPRHECHECKTKFDFNAPDGTACSKCSHPKCTDCQRLKPQRVEPEPDPEVLKSLEARMGKLKVG